jgi:hypothetical protein
LSIKLIYFLSTYKNINIKFLLIHKWSLGWKGKLRSGLPTLYAFMSKILTWYLLIITRVEAICNSGQTINVKWRTSNRYSS